MARGQHLDGARVLITGGGSGIGRRMAIEAARRGAHVILWDLSASAAESVCAEITAAGGTAGHHAVDVADRDAVTAAAATVIAEIGGVDVVINNAGVVSGSRLLDTPETSIERTFDVNVLALFWVTRAFLPGMIDRRRGTVVTIASAAGLVGVARQTDYSASKWAAIGFTESLRSELRSDGHPVSTLTVCPYYVDTGMFAGVTTRFPRLLPILKEDDVARRTVEAIERGREQLIMPPLAAVMPGIRLLPVPLVDKVTDFFGINRTMDHFTGRTGQAARRD
ncbi:putative short chain dehydrogenase/reductase [Tersicoccus solisilvae]|uniref:Short chain dehydrogenase/reductase n=1 Tax=Tersicoccus solisilvae TaxID=1882339 RepID=A0ABQ1P0G0_9MICC|nr:SDR family oxidoreductase [Tersicoccus solisilvae]GGC87840.1 putative short chain dehydrogenase/reductase [Tersicoccus solisilvae]